MQDCDLAAVEKEFARISADPFHDAFLGLHNGTPAFLMERYDPAHRELVGIHAAEPGDVGMHFLSAPTDTPVHGFTRAVITTVMEMLFADPDTRRVVVEPDARNTAVHALNKAVGFEVLRTVSLPSKTPTSAPAPANSSWPPEETTDDRPLRRHPAPVRPGRRRPPHPRPVGPRQPAADPQGPRRVRP